MGARRYALTRDEFVAAWQQARTMTELGRTLCLTRNTVRARAKRYRAQGVRLKEMPGGRPRGS